MKNKNYRSKEVIRKNHMAITSIKLKNTNNKNKNTLDERRRSMKMTKDRI